MVLKCAMGITDNIELNLYAPAIMPVSVPVSEKRFSNVVILTGMRPVTVWSELFACFMQHFRSYSAQRHSKQRKTKKQDFRIRQ